MQSQPFTLFAAAAGEPTTLTNWNLLSRALCCSLTSRTSVVRLSRDIHFVLGSIWATRANLSLLQTSGDAAKQRPLRRRHGNSAKQQQRACVWVWKCVRVCACLRTVGQCLSNCVQTAKALYEDICCLFFPSLAPSLSLFLLFALAINWTVYWTWTDFPLFVLLLCSIFDSFYDLLLYSITVFLFIVFFSVFHLIYVFRFLFLDLPWQFANSCAKCRA